jgi:hypothetical protein
MRTNIKTDWDINIQLLKLKSNEKEYTFSIFDRFHISFKIYYINITELNNILLIINQK